MDVRSRVVGWSSWGLLAFPLPLFADGFAPNTWNEIGRKFGIGHGPGYHAVPCGLADGLHYQHVTGMLPTPNVLPPAAHYFPAPVSGGPMENGNMPEWMEQQRKAITPYLLDKSNNTNKASSPNLSLPDDNAAPDTDTHRSPSDRLPMPSDPGAPPDDDEKSDSLREELPPPTLDRSQDRDDAPGKHDAYDALDDAMGDENESLLDEESGSDVTPGQDAVPNDPPPASSDDDESLLDEAALEPIPMQRFSRASHPAIYRLPPVTAGPAGSAPQWANQVVTTKPATDYWGEFSARSETRSMWQSPPVPYPVVPGPNSTPVAGPAPNVTPHGPTHPPTHVASPNAPLHGGNDGLHTGNTSSDRPVP